jgi:glycopeptide antibiotics resistance protein
MSNQDCQGVFARWANRFLIISVIGIACMTLFPFQFRSAGHSVSHGSPFLLGTTAKKAPPSDFFLNILLFIPFGFALSAQRYKRGGRRWTTLVVALFAGAMASYTVEFLQFYIPSRNSAWDDVLPNTAGSVAGFFVFELCGHAILARLSKIEDYLDEWLSPHRTAALLLGYFTIWSGISIPLQHQTRLSNWDSQSVLFVGNDASGLHPWKGQLFRLQLWNRALPEELVHEMAAGAPEPPADESSLLASYNFTTPSPFRDQRNRLPGLALISTSLSSVPWKQEGSTRRLDLNGDSWLSTNIPAEDLTREIKDTNQFTVRIVCAPGEIEQATGWIVSLSQSAENVNFHLRQEGPNLALWFRNPLSEGRSLLVWYVPGVFQAGQSRDIVASYDGSNAFLYVNGKSVPGSYRLSPGAAIKHTFSYITTNDLRALAILYEMLVFVPTGLLIGMAARKWNTWNRFGKSIVVIGTVLPPLLLEFILVALSGRSILPGNILVSALLCIAGAMLMNADRTAAIE